MKMTDENFKEYNKLYEDVKHSAYGIVGTAKAIIDMYDTFEKGHYTFEMAIKSLRRVVAEYEMKESICNRFYTEHNEEKKQEVA